MPTSRPSGNPPQPSTSQSVTIHEGQSAEIGGAVPVVVQVAVPKPPKWLKRLLWLALLISVGVNFAFYFAFSDYFSDSRLPEEKFHSGDVASRAKIAVIRVNGAIMPPFTERTIRTIRKAAGDDDVKGVLLVIDSPGGLVADSHQIYRELKRMKKPVYVQMKRIAASGGLYIAMGGGTESRIFAEPTTTTGSIGIIISRYDVSKFLKKHDIEVAPLTTGKMKDSLSPFREMRDDEKKFWDEYMKDSYDRFVSVLAENRKSLDEETIRKWADGRVFHASQALELGFVDTIGFEDDALKALKKKLEADGEGDSFRVVSYYTPRKWIDLLLDYIEARDPETTWQRIAQLSVSQPMYYPSHFPLPAFGIED